ncbi:MAG: hypothetical protein GEV28_17760 [Actinophytocola sp.]|uniref:hypothetical protein n=1 Tax=Actinophytocola sp. TaxID=1872138 RepID=UPI0013298C24|nr:hypothetical protein [Actinophytocola sp.]MPZ82135.1 hypothetical protein [Actinophytocola sp.]
MALTETQLRAVVRYPALSRLVALREDHRWTFSIECVEDGGVDLVAGGRLWPNGWSEAIAVRDTNDVRAFRLDPSWGEVWSREGGLIEVVDTLLELPEPGRTGAPTLVKGLAPRLWVPGRA